MGTRRGSFLKKAPPNPRKDFQRILVWCEHTGLHNKRKPTNGRLLSDCRQSSESFRPPFSKGGAVEGAKPSSPSADGETLLSALSFCSFAKQSVLFSYNYNKNVYKRKRMPLGIRFLDYSVCFPSNLPERYLSVKAAMCCSISKKTAALSSFCKSEPLTCVDRRSNPTPINSTC